MGEIITTAIEDALKNTVVRFLRWIELGIIDSSYWICLLACLISLLLYISGQKKAGKVTSISFVIYFLLQAIKGAFIK